MEDNEEQVEEDGEAKVKLKAFQHMEGNQYISASTVAWRVN